MKTPIEPPPVPPLDPARRMRLRHQILAEAMPRRMARPRRRWTAPALATAAVVAVVAGGLAVSDYSGSAPPPVSGTTPTTAIKLDRGPATDAEIRVATKSCDQGSSVQSKVVWSRKVANFGPLRPQTEVLVILRGVVRPLKLPSVNTRLGLVACFSGLDGVRTDSGLWGPAPISTYGVILRDIPVILYGPDEPRSVRFRQYNLLPPGVTRIESRISWADGRTGAWYEGVVVNGVGYSAGYDRVSPPVAVPVRSADGPGMRDVVADSRAKQLTHEATFTLETRGFDAGGKQVPLVR